jgi:hypothetical protein
MRRAFTWTLVLLLGLAPGLYAQIAGGNLYGTVTDESGAVLPGASVTLTSDYGTRTTTTSSTGGFRFLNLERGRYAVAVSLSGFASVKREVSVVTGENATVDFSLKVATVAETVTVTGESPLVDLKKRGTATTMTAEELQKVPNARDPWGVLKNVPGVLLDRVNIAGNENGQQANLGGKGAANADNTWNLDGLNVTDMSATGSSPTYYDFGAFEEITVTTGGAELTMQTGGKGINLVTKRGTNKFHGGARYVLAHHRLSSSNLPDEMTQDPRLKGSGQADHIEQISEYGFDLGGPIVKDKLWFYGTFGKQDIRLRRLNQTPDKTLLPSYNAKINWQATSRTAVSAFYFQGSKQKFGRQPGYQVPESADTLWNQANAYTKGGLPGGLWKLQVDHTFSPSLFISAKAAYYDTGFGFTPTGGTDKELTLDFVRGEAIGSSYTYLAVRPLKTGSLDGSYFFSGLGGTNELKFGFGYRNVTTNSVTSYSGNQLVGEINSDDPAENRAYVYRDGNVNYGGKYTAAYVGDVLTFKRFTINAGLRWDLQTARNLASAVPANKAFPNLLPALEYQGDRKDLIRWSDVSPRLGMSYALDADRRTVLRASFARYAGQLSYGDIQRENPVAISWLYYPWTDLNGDRFPQADEVDTSTLIAGNVDPERAGDVGSTAGKIDRDLGAKHDYELVLGIDRELAANFAVGAAYTWRRSSDWAYTPRLGGDCADPSNPTASTCRIIQPAEYEPSATDSKNGFAATALAPDESLVEAGHFGRIETNRPGYYTLFNGIELTATKRLSNRWMGRLAFSFNDWTEHWKAGVTPTGGNLNAVAGNPTAMETDPLVNGGQVALLSGGSGKASFYTSVKWQMYANGLVQLPWGFDLSGALFGRQGGPYPLAMRLDGGQDSTLAVLVTPRIDAKRYENVWNLDLRLARALKLRGTSLTLAAEVFNVLNNGVVLSRYRYVDSSVFVSTGAGARPDQSLGRIEEVLSPRIARITASFAF